MSTMTITESKTLTFNVHTCNTCGVYFAITTALEADRRLNHASFYCPNGHSLYYAAKTDAELARDQLAKAREQVAAERAYSTRLNDEITRLTKEAKRLAKRAKAGVCPCCNRTFVALSRHMNTKHPTYDAVRMAKGEAVEQ